MQPFIASWMTQIWLTAAKLTCPCNMLRTPNSFARSDTGVVNDSEPYLSRTCKTSILFAPLAVRVQACCSAFPFYTLTKPFIRLYLKQKQQVSMIRKYHNHKPQTTPRHREEEPPNHHETPGKQTKQNNQPPPPLPTKTTAILERTLSNAQQNTEQLQTPTMGVTTNRKSTTTEPPP